MGLGDRIGLVFGNIIVMIPAIALLIASAIMSAIGSAKLKKLNQTDKVKSAYKWVTMSTLILWGVLIGGLIFAFTIGLFFVTIPYLFGGALILFALLNFVLAGFLFYGADAARTSEEYKDPTNANYDNAQSAFKNLLICGIMMSSAGVFLILYAIWTIYKYSKAGGLTGDVALVGKYGGEIAAAVGQPEFAIPLQTIGGMAEKRLSDSQRAELAQRQQQFSAIQAASGQGSYLKNPEKLIELLQQQQ